MTSADPKPNTAAFAVKEAILSLGGPQSATAVNRWVRTNYPNRWDDKTIGSHLRGCSVNLPAAIHYHRSFPRFLYQPTRGAFEIYDPNRHGTYDSDGYAAGMRPASAIESDVADEIREFAEEVVSSNEFAYEAHLRDYLARNLSILEEGLSLWTGELDESVEYPVENRRVDILAKDRDGFPVVIELKLSRGHDKTLGQALYYRGKLREVLPASRVRIIMVAAEITDELRIASAEVADVDLFNYALTMQVTKLVTDNTSETEK